MNCNTNRPLPAKFFETTTPSWLEFGIHAAAALVVVGAFLPLIRSGQWWIRMFDCPPIQLICVGGMFNTYHAKTPFLR